MKYSNHFQQTDVDSLFSSPEISSFVSAEQDGYENDHFDTIMRSNAQRNCLIMEDFRQTILFFIKC